MTITEVTVDRNINRTLLVMAETRTDVVVILLIIIILMQGIYNYIPQTNHVSRVYSVAAVLYLQFVLHVMSPVKYVYVFLLLQ